MILPWVRDELDTVALANERLNNRLRIVLSQLSERPTASIPAACGGHAEMTAAYRLFDHEQITFADILRPHFTSTLRRMANESVVVLAQDTTELDLTRPQQVVAGAGPLDGARLGALVHVLHGFTPNGTPLGSWQAHAWARDPEAAKCAAKSRAERAATPLEEKESQRWLTMLRHAEAAARECPATHFVGVADSEADIYEMFLAGDRPSNLDWIVRSCQDRALCGEHAGETPTARLREQVAKSEVLWTCQVSVRGREQKVSCDERRRRQPRESREAELEVRAATVTLRPPWRPQQSLPPVTVNAVLARETHPPEGDEPIEWLLLTSLPIDSPSAVQQVVEYYRARWMIEIFFRVLKSGCRAEERRLETLDRQLNCLAVYLIVAWRTLFVCRLGRSCPEVNCEAVFEPAEWKATWKIVKRQDPPDTPPKLGVMIRLVAQLGGYVPRPKSEPGPQTIWLGLQRVHDFAQCWTLFGPKAKKPVKTV